MDDLVKQLCQRTGINEQQARQVVAFLQEHASELPKWLGSTGLGKGLGDKLPGGLGGMLGGKS